MSDVPPGGYGTMILIGLFGYACACTIGALSKAAHASNQAKLMRKTRGIVMICLLMFKRRCLVNGTLSEAVEICLRSS